MSLNASQMDATRRELQANFDAGGRARGVMGLYWFNGDAGGQVLNYFSNPLAPPALTNPLFGDTQGYVNTSSIAVYADWTFDLTDQLKLDVGARYTDEDKRAIVLNRFYADATFTRPIAVAADVMSSKICSSVAVTNESRVGK